MPELHEIPDKQFFRTTEVCQLTDTQPYVLRFWESEFPQLSPERGRGGQALYRRRDVDIVMRIKRLLYDEEYTIDGARRRLEEELNGGGPAESACAPDDADVAPLPADAARGAASEVDAVPRWRYDDAVEEIELLRLKLREAEASLRKTEARAQRAEEAAARERERVERAAQGIERALERLGAKRSA